MKRQFRLTQTTDFKRVRRSGKVYAHPFLVLSVLKADCSRIRFGISVGKPVGNAVVRNTVKRRIRAALQEIAPHLVNGYDVVVGARHGCAAATYRELSQVLENLLSRANLIQPNAYQSDE